MHYYQLFFKPARYNYLSKSFYIYLIDYLKNKVFFWIFELLIFAEKVKINNNILKIRLCYISLITFFLFTIVFINGF